MKGILMSRPAWILRRFPFLKQQIELLAISGAVVFHMSLSGAHQTERVSSHWLA